MKITTWNVNGIRSLKTGIETILADLSSDIACFQETKVSRSQIPETLALIDGFSSCFSYPRKQSGYSGVATYCRETFTPEDAEEGLPTSLSNDIEEENALACWELSDADLAAFDHEGRIVTTYHLIKKQEEVCRLAIINVYCPRVDPEKLERHIYKMQFCLLLESKVRKLCLRGCSVIIVGDMNIAHSVIDHCDPGPESEFNSSEARQWLRSFLKCKIDFLKEKVGIIDAFRHFYPDKTESYTCWNTKTGARQTNYGTRIDYILVTSDLLPFLESCEILSDYQGSDHCPAQAVLRCDGISERVAQLPSICTRLWPEFSGQQQKLSSFFKRSQGNQGRDLGKVSDGLLKPTATKTVVGKNKRQKTIGSFFKASAPNGTKVSVPNGNTIFKASVPNSKSFCKDGGFDSDNKMCHHSVPTSILEQEISLSSDGTVSSLLKLNTNGMDIAESSDAKSMSFPANNTSIHSTQSPIESNVEKLNCNISKLVDKGNSKTSSGSSSSMAWKSMLSGPPKPPLCSGHQKECVMRTVKKKGANFGRNFFMCSQPAGHLSNPDASCNFFQWVNGPRVNSLKKLQNVQ